MPVPAFDSPADAIRAWVDGWVVSRGAADPVPQPWGLTVDVGLPHHATRHVLTDADEATVRKLAEAYGAPAVALKVFLEPETVAPWLGPEWVSDGPGWLMTTPLAGRPGRETPAAPDGYALKSWRRGGVTRVLVVAPDGGFAARGQVAPTGGTAVVDQVETAPAHRRKGLGALVMSVLHEAAYAQGATVGILGATTDGRGLYESLGWQECAPLVGVTYRAA
ncbi:GNAT family N-acetyltransferase [Streptomyces agglomeratus]|uniref:GNAT family N-acetyltransferase n=1 Tax=Streptomyces agglomeratus TaxID=285458 RepID=A0A1E5P655_9ACTN|nr:GNAT family N-acetyltransferase [Streptomyces agglomeratus]OEJ25048.1 GNAT family N-acetyltransferase [Streptomyces agglomeratus]OEJ40927.1 GNAT family N-acetyltransferase [Streptomyces agglomeratus]OEJ44695.1 GNAT family N-acetyltransferase [Streptomyces agglomeratus]OEJ53463.1 GNAT family N-acetyltransferase [Streptomyces agglomeratus]OEJ60803.1 GNAT family N-acetyltransferase [Streptomyces agglomeratus]